MGAASSATSGGGLNISNKLRNYFVFPCAAFISFPDTKGYIEYQDNPEDRLIEEPTSSNLGWIIAYAKFGTSVAVVPKFFDSLAPSRIEVALPDQTEWPSSLWSRLDARDSVHIRSEDFQKLGIAIYLRLALGKWAEGIPNFEGFYRGLPFGSRITLTSFEEDPSKAKFEVSRSGHSADGPLRSRKQLGEMWHLEADAMPPEISYLDLCFKHHIAGDVIVVSLRKDPSQRMAFKSSRKAPLNIYHEIKVLLTMPPADCIIGRPLYLVTIPMGKEQTGVCGFLLEFYDKGCLEDILTDRRLNGTLVFKDQLQWALDLTSALLHIQASPAHFYSDLRMDQLVLRTTDDGKERAVLLDFEQSRNIYNWAPPEIYYLEWIAELGSQEYARTDHLSAATMSKYGAILARYLKSRGHPETFSLRSHYDNPDHGWYWPWITSKPTEQESGMVYMLGKALWCLFEGFGDADIVLGRSGREDGQRRFPAFERTPEPLRGLIRQCTQGAREWIDGPIKIYRRGGKVFPLGKTGLQGEHEGTLEETKDTIRQFWKNEMEKAERFVEARIRHDKGQAEKDDVDLLYYLRRPSLKTVQKTLQAALQET